jgi:hypothetical protein
MHPVIQQALNLFRQGIISQAQLDKLTAQFAPQAAQVPTLGATGTTTPPPGVNMAPPQPGYPITPPPAATIGTRG